MPAECLFFFCLQKAVSRMLIFYPLLIFEILMDPNVSPLQVINLTNKSTAAYTSSTEYAFDTV